MGWRVRYGIFLYTVWICHHDGLNKEANGSIAGQDEVRGKAKQRLLGRRRAKSEVVNFQRKTWDCKKYFPTLPTGLDRIRFSIYTKCCGTQLSKTSQQPHPLRIKVPKFPVCGPYTVSEQQCRHALDYGHSPGFRSVVFPSRWTSETPQNHGFWVSGSGLGAGSLYLLKGLREGSDTQPGKASVLGQSLLPHQDRALTVLTPWLLWLLLSSLPCCSSTVPLK